MTIKEKGITPDGYHKGVKDYEEQIGRKSHLTGKQASTLYLITKSLLTPVPDLLMDKKRTITEISKDIVYGGNENFISIAVGNENFMDYSDRMRILKSQLNIKRGEVDSKYASTTNTILQTLNESRDLTEKRMLKGELGKIKIKHAKEIERETDYLREEISELRNDIINQVKKPVAEIIGIFIDNNIVDIKQEEGNDFITINENYREDYEQFSKLLRYVSERDLPVMFLYKAIDESFGEKLSRDYRYGIDEIDEVYINAVNAHKKDKEIIPTLLSPIATLLNFPLESKPIERNLEQMAMYVLEFNKKRDNFLSNIIGEIEAGKYYTDRVNLDRSLKDIKGVIDPELRNYLEEAESELMRFYETALGDEESIKEIREKETNLDMYYDMVEGWIRDKISDIEYDIDIVEKKLDSTIKENIKEYLSNATRLGIVDFDEDMDGYFKFNEDFVEIFKELKMIQLYNDEDFDWGGDLNKCLIQGMVDMGYFTLTETEKPSGWDDSETVKNAIDVDISNIVAERKFHERMKTASKSKGKITEVRRQYGDLDFLRINVLTSKVTECLEYPMTTQRKIIESLKSKGMSIREGEINYNLKTLKEFGYAVSEVIGDEEFFWLTTNGRERFQSLKDATE